MVIAACYIHDILFISVMWYRGDSSDFVLLKAELEGSEYPLIVGGAFF